VRAAGPPVAAAALVALRFVRIAIGSRLARRRRGVPLHLKIVALRLA
jgi:hypothetical protein